jgi:exopolyphosphatase/guanosine-5'-triphosphate,3'-diphosphate pyrophosphatase
MRLATIDLGTNTVRLLVADISADGRWHAVVHDQRVTRLGEGLAASGRLGDTPMRRTTAMVTEYARRAKATGARALRIVATSAVRDAANGREFAVAVERATGQAVEIVSGEEEARLTIRGIVAGLGASQGTLLAFDIGGGSTEYILAHAGRVETAISLRLGVVPLSERFPFPARVDADRYRAMESEIRTRLGQELPHAVRVSGAPHLVGTAGTVTTLAALDLGLQAYDATRVQGHRLSRASLEKLRDRLCALTQDERGRLPCLEPGRADLIVPGVAIVLASLDVTQMEAIVASDWGLREGIMAETVERLS